MYNVVLNSEHFGFYKVPYSGTADGTFNNIGLA